MTATLTGTRSLKAHTLLWVVLAAALGIGLAAIVGLQREAQAGIPGPYPPKVVLMKGSQELQVGRRGSYCWNDSDGAGICVDSMPSYPARDLVRAGSELHIKIFKAQRPDRFSVVAYRELDGYGFPPYGEGQRLDTTLRRVERDGETVAWNVFFRVSEPYRHYYLDTFGTWKRVPGSEATYGDAIWHFHVKTLRLSTGWGW